MSEAKTYGIAEKILLQPTRAQAVYLKRCCEVARVGYNWALGEWGRQYEAHKADESLKKPSAMALGKQFRRVRETDYPFCNEVFANCHVGAIHKNLDKAFKNFFAGRAKYPNFKKRGLHDNSFYIANVEGRINGRRFKVPQPRGNQPMWVKLRKSPRIDGKVNSYTVMCTASGKWYLCISYTVDEAPYTTTGKLGTVGVDVNISGLVISDGRVIGVPKEYQRLQKRLTMLQRRISKKRGGAYKCEKGSNKWRETKHRIAVLHEKIADIRQNYIHQLTSELAKNAEHVGIESLNLKGIQQNHTLSRAMTNIGASEFRRQLEYKCKWSGAQLAIIDQFEHPSTQTCSRCGNRKIGADKLSLGNRTYMCDKCRLVIDRDLNAAINLAQWALEASTPEPGESQGGGDTSGGRPTRKSPKKLRVTRKEAATHKPIGEAVCSA